MSEPYVWDGVRHDPGYYEPCTGDAVQDQVPMMYDGQAGRILMQGVGVWIVEKVINPNALFMWYKHGGQWLFVATAQVREVEDRCQPAQPDIIIQIPIASAVVQRIGITRTINEIKGASQVIVTHPRHGQYKPLDKPGTKDILAIYRGDNLNVWSTGHISPFYAMTAEMANAPEGHVCIMGYPTYGGTYKEDY